MYVRPFWARELAPDKQPKQCSALLSTLTLMDLERYLLASETNVGKMTE